MQNLGKFSEEQFNKLKSGAQQGVQNLGKMTDQAFQQFKDSLSRTIEVQKNFSPASRIEPKTEQNIPAKNNNPLNLKIGGVADKFAIAEDKFGHLIFNSLEDFKKGAKADFNKKISGKSHYEDAKTIKQFAEIYAGDSKSWLKNVTTALGLSANYNWRKIPIEKFMDAIAVAEGAIKEGESLFD